ncbi:MAG TPA: NADH-quinone oxidoreductase subunit I [Firmicutes bacterium]|nr:NADH-quinone oxidoreductase subunit I [Bacillota bacterium]
MFRYIAELIKGSVSLLEGLGITLKHMFHPAITLQYPEKKPELPLRFRGRLVMPVDFEKGTHRCTACMICVKACPNGSLDTAKKVEDGRPKPVAEWYSYNLSTCIFCNLCVESCPFSAIIMSDEYECSVYERKDMMLELVSEEYKLEGKKAKWWQSKFKEEE